MLYIGNTYLADLPCVFLWKIWYISEQGKAGVTLSLQCLKDTYFGQ